jgi:hypothetical protein
MSDATTGVFAAIIFFTASVCDAQDFVCKPNLIGEDMCRRASEITAEIGKMLPMKTNDGTTLVGISAENTTVSVVGRWELSGQQLSDSVRRSGISVSEFREKGAQSTKMMACGADVLASFVRLGGELRYTYYSSDGARVFETLVVNCDEAN